MHLKQKREKSTPSTHAKVMQTADLFTKDQGAKAARGDSISTHQSVQPQQQKNGKKDCIIS
jgi:hypothetical protein